MSGAIEKVLIVNAGMKRPNGEGGRLNDTMAGYAREVFAATGFDVLETDLKNVWTLDEEVAKVAEARLLLVQTPIWAMTAPWQYIRWQDEVLTHPKVCGTDGRTRTDPTRRYGTGGFLTDRFYWLSTTWNAPLEAINEPGQFFDGRGLEEVLMPLHKQFAYMGMRPLAPSFAVTDVYKNPTIEADLSRWQENLEAVAARLRIMTKAN